MGNDNSPCPSKYECDEAVIDFKKIIWWFWVSTWLLNLSNQLKNNACLSIFKSIHLQIEQQEKSSEVIFDWLDYKHGRH